MPKPRIEPESEVVARVGATALTLPAAYEEDAWTGVRWRIRGRTFAHVLVAQEGYESSYRMITGVRQHGASLWLGSLTEDSIARLDS